jgi:hypothetical protein
MKGQVINFNVASGRFDVLPIELPKLGSLKALKGQFAKVGFTMGPDGKVDFKSEIKTNVVAALDMNDKNNVVDIQAKLSGDLSYIQDKVLFETGGAKNKIAAQITNNQEKNDKIIIEFPITSKGSRLEYNSTDGGKAYLNIHNGKINRPDQDIRIDLKSMSIIGNEKNISLAIKQAKLQAGLFSMPIENADISYMPLLQNGKMVFGFSNPKFDGKIILKGQHKLNMTLVPTPQTTILLDAILENDHGIGLHMASVIFPNRDIESDFSFIPLDFNKDDLQPSDLSAFTEQLKGRFGGKINIQGKSLFKAAKVALTGKLDLTLEDISLRQDNIELSDIQGNLTFDLAHMPATQPDQIIKGRLSVGPVQRMPFIIKLQLLEGGAAFIKELKMSLLDGNIFFRDLRLDTQKSDVVGLIDIQNISSEKILKLLESHDVGLTGQFSGKIPVKISGETVIITNGLIEALTPGVFNYRGDAFGQTGMDQASMSLVATALQNFHYEALVAKLNLPPNGEGTIALHLKGFNPEVLNGYPFEFNIVISSNYAKIIKSLLAIYRQTENFIQATSMEVAK